MSRRAVLWLGLLLPLAAGCNAAPMRMTSAGGVTSTGVVGAEAPDGDEDAEAGDGDQEPAEASEPDGAGDPAVGEDDPPRRRRGRRRRRRRRR